MFGSVWDVGFPCFIKGLQEPSHRLQVRLLPDPLMLVLDLLALFLVTATGAGGLYLLWRHRPPEQRGKENLRELRDKARCYFCLKPVDPEVDIYDNKWFHFSCYTNKETK